MTRIPPEAYPRRIYPLDAHQLSEEQIAVTFAMTSRNPDSFDKIAQQVSQEKAADFHERWVLGYGHASVAEHAVVHLAVENISRLACDTLEDNRLASYTEKSSRYQVIPPGFYHVPKEIEGNALKELYISTCDSLLNVYREALLKTQDYLRSVRPRKENESASAYNLRIRRESTDSCRFLLPAGTLTNVGITINVRSLEHAISKLLSSDLQEEREIGKLLKEKSREIAPTLVKYADENSYLMEIRNIGQQLIGNLRLPISARTTQATLLHYDSYAEHKIVAAFLYRFSGVPYSTIWERVRTMPQEELSCVIGEALQHLGPFDSPVRETELVDYIFEFVMDYGAYRELKRHRMQTYIPQSLTVTHGYILPPLIVQSGMESQFESVMNEVEYAYNTIGPIFPRVAEYLVTHAHLRRMLTKLNLRECYHLFKLRTQPGAHFTLRLLIVDALEQIRLVHPDLAKYIRLRT